MLLPLLPMARRARLLLLLALVSEARGAQRWLLHGGYTGYEGTGGATPEVIYILPGRALRILESSKLKLLKMPVNIYIDIHKSAI